MKKKQKPVVTTLEFFVVWAGDRSVGIWPGMEHVVVNIDNTTMSHSDLDQMRTQLAEFFSSWYEGKAYSKEEYEKEIVNSPY